jgi:TPR repeat protein
MAVTQDVVAASTHSPIKTSAAVSGVEAQAAAKPELVKRVPKPAAVQNVMEPGRGRKFGKPRIISVVSDTMAERPSLNKRSQPTMPDELWAQVKKNDSDAEVELARMYLEGASVPRNCIQAQILLEAASRHGNARAIDLLNDGETECH